MSPMFQKFNIGQKHAQLDSKEWYMALEHNKQTFVTASGGMETMISFSDSFGL